MPYKVDSAAGKGATAASDVGADLATGAGADLAGAATGGDGIPYKDDNDDGGAPDVADSAVERDVAGVADAAAPLEDWTSRSGMP